jgi:hypothetical protein
MECLTRLLSLEIDDLYCVTRPLLCECVPPTRTVLPRRKPYPTEASGQWSQQTQDVGAAASLTIPATL